MTVGYKVLFSFLVGIVLVLLMGKLLAAPLKIAAKLAVNALLGAAVLIAVNWLGSFVGFGISFNIYTAFIVGMLGVPGFILLIVLKLLFGIA